MQHNLDPFEAMSEAQFQAWIDGRLAELESREIEGRGDFSSFVDDEALCRLIGE